MRSFIIASLQEWSIRPCDGSPHYEKVFTIYFQSYYMI
jgi:hypothetical protein